MTTWSALAVGTPFLVASFGIGWGVTRLGVAIASRRIRRADGEPWIERARLAYPARRLVRLNMIVLIVVLAECVYLGRFCALGPWSEVAWGAALSCLAGLIGVMIVGLRLERQLCRADDGPSEAGIPLF